MKPEDFYRIFLQFPQICTDSRKVTPGCLYFALRGDHFDGNRFAAEALSRGSRIAVVDDPAFADGPDFLLVTDVLRFLQDLAAIHRDNLRIPVIGLTGTNGKTTTKELIHVVLKQKFNVVATKGNLNNHIGVPLTILSADAETEILIVEMGANHPGEIDFLCRLARPTCGMITNIGKAHLEGFGSFEGVVRAKRELYDFLMESGGKIFQNADDLLLSSLTGSFPVYTYGTVDRARIHGTVTGHGKYLTIEWKTAEDHFPYQIASHLSGTYNASNILAAIATGVSFELNPSQIRAGIEAYVPVNLRSQWIETEHNTLFLDAYNANPSSMGLAIESFIAHGLPHPVAILGDMFELGDHAATEHLKMIRQAGQAGFEKILFAGLEFSNYAKEFPFEFFTDTTSLSLYLKLNKLKDCTILIKGSRGMQLEQLVDYL